MKTFEEWWEKFEPQIDPDTYHGEVDELRRAIGRCTWKAALEWTKDEILECLGPRDALEIIREELENE